MEEVNKAIEERKEMEKQKAIEIMKLLNGLPYHQIVDILKDVKYYIKNDLPIQVVF